MSGSGAELTVFVVSQGLMQSCSGDSLAEDPNVRMITLYDNEEVSEVDPQPVRGSRESSVFAWFRAFQWFTESSDEVHINRL